MDNDTSLEVRDYTNVWHIERRWYAIGDARLPIPGGASARQLITLLVVGFPWCFLISALPLPLHGGGLFAAYVTVPFGSAYLVGRVLLDGKQLPELVRSATDYGRQGTRYANLAVWAEPDTLHLRARAHVRTHRTVRARRMTAFPWTPSPVNETPR